MIKANQQHRARGMVAAAMLVILAGAAFAMGASTARTDPTFGHRGFVFTPTGETGNSWSAFGLAEDRAGRLVAVGGANDSFVIARYRTNGSLDPAFGGGDGKVYIGGWRDEPANQRAAATAVAIQSNGKLVVAGYVILDEDPPFRDTKCFALVRLNPNGSFDSSFASFLAASYPGGGRLLDCPGTEPFSVAIQRDRKILVSGHTPRNGTTGLSVGVITRFESDGRIDRDFGPNHSGSVRFVPPPGRRNLSGILDLSLLPSGKILASGYYRFRFLLARLNPDGSPDRSFGSQKAPGRVITDVDTEPNCPCAIGWGMARDRKGRIVVTGFVQLPRGRNYVVVVRHRANGKLDSQFGDRGIVRTRIGSYASARHLAVQSNGRVVVAGLSGSRAAPRLTLLRYRSSGLLDSSFFGDGVYVRPIGSESGARDILTDHSGRIVASGGAIVGGRKGFVVSRILPGQG